MIDVSISTAESGAKKVRLGKQGENGVRKIIFGLQSMVNRYGDGLATLVFQRNGDTAPYVVTATREENSLVWIVSSADTAKAGPGRAEIRWFVDGALAKTVIFATETIASIVEDTEMPDVMQTWYDQMVDYVDAQPQIVIGEVQRMIDGKADVATVDNVYAKKTDIPTRLSKLTNDAGFITEIPEEYVTDTELEDVRSSLSAMIGSPLVAASAAEMTDTDRVYVYTGAETGYENGDWYYYDSGISQWRSGGVYNSTAVTTDKTLSVENSAADAKATGDAIGELKENITNIGTPPKIMETEEDVADLFIGDDNGNVIAEFVNGGIKTKNFNSAEILGNFPTNSENSYDIADSEGFVIARFEDGHIKTKNFDSTKVVKPCEYMISDTGDLYLSYGYTVENDAVIKMNEGRSNGLFDFDSFYLKPSGKSLTECQSRDFSVVWLTGTDMHSPFEFLAVNNPDGEYAGSTDPAYTGGNHIAEINGVTLQTAISNGVHFFADGKPVSSGHGVFSKFEIMWSNSVQAYNCLKADGTGRTSLTEYHDMIFDGIKFDEEITLIPDEDINMYLWQGLQSVAWNSVYDHAYFVDATNRQIFTPSDSTIVSGNAITSAIVQYGDTHAMKMEIDITKDLGKRPHYSGNEGAFLSNSIHKGYFRIFNGAPVLMSKDSVWCLHGSYRFYPV